MTILVIIMNITIEYRHSSDPIRFLSLFLFLFLLIYKCVVQCGYLIKTKPEQKQQQTLHISKKITGEKKGTNVSMYHMG